MTDAVRTHPAFCEAIAEIESLGVRVSDHPVRGAIPYTIIGGRSNARWWLIPLQNNRVTASGLALFQPVVASARLMKWAAATLTQRGFGGIWAKPELYISETPSIGNYFGNKTLSYAYFTGTDSPHRKVAVQVMDMNGRLKGFAKITKNPLVRPLLQHEAATLSRVRGLGLVSAIEPRVLFCGEQNGTSLLVTDTLKTALTKTTTALLPIHAEFLRELGDRAPVPHHQPATSCARLLRDRLAVLNARLPAKWLQRLQRAIDQIGARPGGDLLPATLTHGDFTPWNTFLIEKKIYVFDWEYAEDQFPASNDLIHFMLVQPPAKNQPAAVKIDRINATLRKVFGLPTNDLATTHLLIYLTSHALRYIERHRSQPGMIETWDGASEQAVLIDSVLRRS